MEKNEHRGYLCCGPVSALGPFFELFYVPTKEQVKNLQTLFGWNYVTHEQYVRLCEEYNEKWNAEHPYKPLFDEK